jgi:hypothetical protein
MFVVTEADAAAIRAVFDQQGELSAAIELRRRFPGITDNAKARAHDRSIAGWTPLPAQPRPERRLRSAGETVRKVGVIRPLSETGVGPNAPPRHNPD